jgi:hypothetical protein
MRNLSMADSKSNYNIFRLIKLKDQSGIIEEILRSFKHGVVKQGIMQCRNRERIVGCATLQLHLTDTCHLLLTNTLKLIILTY